MSQLPMPMGLHILKAGTCEDGKTTMVKITYNGELLPIFDIDYANALSFAKQWEEKVIDDMYHRSNEHAVQKVYNEYIEEDSSEIELDEDFEQDLNDEDGDTTTDNESEDE